MSARAVTAAEMQRLHELLLAQYRLSFDALVENAARDVTIVLRRLAGGSVVGQRILVLSGRGRTGAVGIASARHIANAGGDVAVTLLPGPGALAPEASRQTDVAEAAGITVSPAIETEPRPHLVVDALGGPEQALPPQDLARLLIDEANGLSAPILSIDVPAGLDPDDGRVHAPCIRATWTLALGLPKAGTLAPGARAATGHLLLGDIGIPFPAYASYGVEKPLFSEGYVIEIGP
ncbi:MAG: NAD(P)H-hydrate epimerase [Methanobacteriota archaeon]